MALLCYLGAGQTHKTKGPYRRNIEKGLAWLVLHQEKDGFLAKNCISPMYSHGLATIALCEAFALSGDRNVGAAAQAAVDYIVLAQNKNDYGWRYNAGDPGDTSVTSWQIMALKSAQLAGLSLGDKQGTVLDLAGQWLNLVKTGPSGSRFQYQPGNGDSLAMTAAGLLGRQHLGAKHDNPMMVEGVKYLMDNMPDANNHNVYYWFDAAQVVHKYGGDNWDAWNRALRKLLVSTQVRDLNRCANGSWDPVKPSADNWGQQGGRHMVTAMSCLTLEISDCHLGLYKVEAAGKKGGAQKAPRK